jgi:pantetheine-phosphate adenylyltransferase
MNKAVFPGSFDPFTKGHANIIERTLNLFDEIVIAIGINSKKQYLFPLENRIQSISNFYQNEPKISVKTYEGLTVNFCQHIGAKYLVRGLRTSSDFDYERTIALMNKSIDKQLETVFIISAPELSAISSTVVREIYNHKGDISQFIPNGFKI